MAVGAEPPHPRRATKRGTIMNLNAANTLSAALAMLSLVACSAANPTPASTKADATDSARVSPPDVSGRWKSACAKTGDERSIDLDVELTDHDWKLDYTTYGDATCATAFITVHVEGAYALGPQSTVTGAWDARFGFAKKTITPHSAAAAGFASSDAACGAGDFAPGKATDVTASGCPGLGQYPVSKCAADFDLVSVDGDSLRFGDRPKDNDMCTEGKRPTALSGLAMARVR
jgi:hypothetical protein